MINSHISSSVSPLQQMYMYMITLALALYVSAGKLQLVYHAVSIDIFFGISFVSKALKWEMW